MYHSCDAFIPMSVSRVRNRLVYRVETKFRYLLRGLDGRKKGCIHCIKFLLNFFRLPVMFGRNKDDFDEDKRSLLPVQVVRRCNGLRTVG